MLWGTQMHHCFKEKEKYIKESKKEEKKVERKKEWTEQQCVASRRARSFQWSRVIGKFSNV